MTSLTEAERTAHAARLAHILGMVAMEYIQMNDFTLADVQVVIPQVWEHLRDASEHADQAVEARRAQMKGEVQ